MSHNNVDFFILRMLAFSIEIKWTNFHTTTKNFGFVFTCMHEQIDKFKNQ